MVTEFSISMPARVAEGRGPFYFVHVAYLPFVAILFNELLVRPFKQLSMPLIRLSLVKEGKASLSTFESGYSVRYFQGICRGQG
jgi:hypothetical protein